MSDKYPSMSPYNYCANNPVILVDPDGREITLFGETYIQGTVYKGENERAAFYWDMLTDINNTRLGKNIITALCKSDKTYNIIPNSDSKGGGVSDPKDNSINFDTGFEALIHELFHAYLDESGHGGFTTFNEVGARLCAYYVVKQYNENVLKGDFLNAYYTTRASQLRLSPSSRLYQQHISVVENNFDEKSFNYLATYFLDFFKHKEYENMKNIASDSQMNFNYNFFKNN
jgi:hypothetical protein